MKKILVNRHQSTRCKKTNRRDNAVKQALRGYQLMDQGKSSGGTSIVKVSADAPYLDDLKVLRSLGAQCERGSVMLAVEVESKAPSIICDPLDAIDHHESMRRRLLDKREQGKLSSGPLLRFLRKSVGKPWREVEAALHRRVGKDFATGSPTWDEIDYRVCKSVELRDGQVFDLERPWTKTMIVERERFYVHPETGLLEKLPRPKNNRTEPKRQFEQMVLSDFQRLIKVDGIWYRVDFEQIPAIDSLPPNKDGLKPCGPEDILLKLEAVDDPSYCYSQRRTRQNWKLDPFLKEWGSAIYAVRKEQANSDELRKYGLNQR